MSATTTTAATTPALNAYLPVLARLLMCGLFIWDGVLQLRNPAGTADYFASLEAKAATRAPHNPFGSRAWTRRVAGLLTNAMLFRVFNGAAGASVALFVTLH